MRHFFVNEAPVIGGLVRLNAKDEDHLLRVLRAENHMPLQIAYCGEVFRGILEITDGTAYVRIEEKIGNHRSRQRLILAQGVGKNQKTETVLKHATECGIDGFIPVQTDRSISNLSKKYNEKKKRFEKIATEAAKQSNRKQVPEIGELVGVEGLIERQNDRSVLVVCYEGDVAEDIMDMEFSEKEDIYVLIGAEGGISEREIVVENKDKQSFDDANESKEHNELEEEMTEETAQELDESEPKAEIQQRLAEMEDRYMRLQADYSNFRRRSAEEKNQMRALGMEKLAIDILPVLDNFERALAVDEVKDQKFFEGMDMIAKQFKTELEKNDIVEIDALNMSFDPNMHHAVMMEEKEGVEANIVTEVLQKGYRLGDRVIRPSIVKVSK